jgi:hypothetical protein
VTVRTRGPFDALVLELEAPGALRAYLHRLLRCRHEDITANDKRVAELDEILNQIQAEPRCRLARVFEAYDQAVTTAQQGRPGARKDVREVMKDEKAFLERLRHNLHTLQHLLANQDCPDPTNLAMRAMRVQRLRKALRELPPYATSSDQPKRGRLEKQLWKKPLHDALQKAGLPLHYERRLNNLFNL